MLAPATLPLADRQQQQFIELLAAARLEALTLLRSLLTATLDTPGAVLRERRLAAQAILKIPTPTPASASTPTSTDSAKVDSVPVVESHAQPRVAPPSTPPATTKREKPSPAPIQSAPQPSHQAPIPVGAGPAARLRACAGADRSPAFSRTG
jgi:hypothetical protein